MIYARNFDATGWILHSPIDSRCNTFNYPCAGLRYVIPIRLTSPADLLRSVGGRAEKPARFWIGVAWWKPET